MGRSYNGFYEVGSGAWAEGFGPFPRDTPHIIADENEMPSFPVHNAAHEHNRAFWTKHHAIDNGVKIV
jgi:hypothetical protein